MKVLEKINSSLKNRNTFQSPTLFLSLFLGVQLRHVLPLFFPHQFMPNQFYLITALLTFIFYVFFRLIAKSPYSEMIESVFVSLGIAYGLDYFIGIFNENFRHSASFAHLPGQLFPLIYILYLFNYKNTSHFIRPMVLAFLFSSNLTYFVINSFPVDIKIHSPWNGYSVVLFFITFVMLMNRSIFIKYIDDSKAKLNSFLGGIVAFLLFTLYFAQSLKVLTFTQSIQYFSKWNGESWYLYFCFVVVVIFILSFARLIPVVVKPKMEKNRYIPSASQARIAIPNSSYKTIPNTNKKNQDQSTVLNDISAISSNIELVSTTFKEPIVTNQNNSDTNNNHEKNEISRLEELKSLIGLDTVKEDINQLIREVRASQLRQEAGLKVDSKSRHLVFTGNPGTGKTTVARLIAKIYAEIGILSKGHIVEVDRAGLIGRYIGDTEDKTENVIQKALGGVLFIDEAYGLANKGENDFGKQAIDILLKRMEDYRDNLIVIVAGYTDNMKEFISSNPGLESRFPKYIEFEDYTPDDMVKIFQLMCKNGDYRPTKEALDKLKETFEEKYKSRDKKFGNGRFVRNAYEKITSNQGNRIALINKPTKEQLISVEVEDISI